jgi:hypothetical protein
MPPSTSSTPDRLPGRRVGQRWGATRAPSRDKTVRGGRAIVPLFFVTHTGLDRKALNPGGRGQSPPLSRTASFRCDRRRVDGRAASRYLVDGVTDDARFRYRGFTLRRRSRSHLSDTSQKHHLGPHVALIRVQRRKPSDLYATMCDHGILRLPGGILTLHGLGTI